jgi:hypothetical protein
MYIKLHCKFYNFYRFVKWFYRSVYDFSAVLASGRTPTVALSFPLLLCAMCPIRSDSVLPGRFAPPTSTAHTRGCSCPCVSLASSNCRYEMERREGRAGRGWGELREVGAKALRQAVVCQPPSPLQHVQHPIYFQNIQMRNICSIRLKIDDTFETCV